MEAFDCDLSCWRRWQTNGFTIHRRATLTTKPSPAENANCPPCFHLHSQSLFHEKARRRRHD